MDLNVLVKGEQTWSKKFHPNKYRVLTITDQRKTIRLLDLIIKFITKVWRMLIVLYQVLRSSNWQETPVEISSNKTPG